MSREIVTSSPRCLYCSKDEKKKEQFASSSICHLCSHSHCSSALSKRHFSLSANLFLCLFVSPSIVLIERIPYEHLAEDPELYERGRLRLRERERVREREREREIIKERKRETESEREREREGD